METLTPDALYLAHDGKGVGDFPLPLPPIRVPALSASSIMHSYAIYYRQLYEFSQTRMPLLPLSRCGRVGKKNDCVDTHTSTNDRVSSDLTKGLLENE